MAAANRAMRSGIATKDRLAVPASSFMMALGKWMMALGRSADREARTIEAVLLGPGQVEIGRRDW